MAKIVSWKKISLEVPAEEKVSEGKGQRLEPRKT